MDNIVDYLVVIFFVISFLSSIFKKKKPTVENTKTKAVQVSKVENIQQRKVNNPFDEFFNSINLEIEKAKKTNTYSEVDDYYDNAMQNSFDPQIIESSMPYQKEFVEPTTRQKSTKLENENSSKSYNSIIKSTKDKRESKKALEIKESLKNSSSIKKFIIMNEILGKPKALQR